MDNNQKRHIFHGKLTSWLSHVSEGLKPDWFALSKLVLSSKSKSELKSNLSKIFSHTGERDTGL